VTRLYLSKTGKLDAGDVELGSRSIGELPAFTSSAGTTLVSIPPATALGSYNILAVADAAGVVPEIDETNNIRKRKIVIQ
jgi:hypothetical protein